MTQQLAQVAVIRVVDKLPGALWGFCRQWMWDQLQASLRKERYEANTAPAKRIVAGLRDLLTKKGWQATGDARIALLYLIGKGKSLRMPAITWRPICAVARPIVPRDRLHIAARAFSCFLRVLTSEIIGCFHHHSVQSSQSEYCLQ